MLSLTFNYHCHFVRVPPSVGAQDVQLNQSW